MHVAPIDSLEAFDGAAAAELVAALRSQLEWNGDLDPARMFAVILQDGLSLREELVTAHLHAALRGVPLVGGSAGDDQRFERTRVLADGVFRSGGGVVALVESALPFRTFQLQHFAPTDRELVITGSDPVSRTVFEIDGEEAVRAYARALDLAPGRLSAKDFSAHPLVIRIGDEWHVRSVQRANRDGSLTFFCAIETGLVLTVARGAGILGTLERRVEALCEEFTEIQGTLGFECIQRRLELVDSKVTDASTRLLDRIGFAGFSTFGEQIGGVHVNQTLTGVVVGTR